MKTVYQSQEVQNIGVFQNQSRCHVATAAQQGQLLADQSIGLLGERGAFVKHGIDALAEGTHAPAFDTRHFGVELSLVGLGQR